MGAYCREHAPTGTIALASVLGSRSRCVRVSPQILGRRGEAGQARGPGRGILIVG
jgi:hypothetical protein